MGVIYHHCNFLYCEPILYKSYQICRLGSESMKEVGVKWYSPGRIIVYAVLIFTTFLSIFPFYWMLVIGSHDTSAVNKFPPAMLPGTNFMVNVHKVFSNI